MTSPFVPLAGFFLVVMASIVAAGYCLVVRPSARKAAGATGTPEPEWARYRLAENLTRREQLTSILERVGQAVSRENAEEKPVRRGLVAAGYRSPSATYVFRGIKAASILLGAVALGWIALWWTRTGDGAAAGALCGAALGYFAPDRVLNALIRSRSYRIRSALPTALEIWALGIEAGQPLDQAMAASARELRRVYPDLSAELAGIPMEMRAGKSRTEAFAGIAARNREPELKKVCRLLIDGDRFGTGLSPALRTHAKYLRLSSRQKAQEAARKVSVKLIFPVFFLIFPSVILITLGPAVLQMMSMFSALSGGK